MYASDSSLVDLYSAGEPEAGLVVREGAVEALTFALLL